MINFKRLALTDIKLDVDRLCKKTALKKAFDEHCTREIWDMQMAIVFTLRAFYVLAAFMWF